MMQTLELTAQYIDSFINNAKVIPFKGDLDTKLEPLSGKAMPLSTKAKVGSPLSSPKPAFSPKKEIRFGALVNSQRAHQIKQETL